MTVVDTLEKLLCADEQFAQLTGDAPRRQHATGLVRTQSGWDRELPFEVRGQVSAAAQNATRWWRDVGRPARTVRLREQLDELATDPRLPGTLAQRTQAAEAVLREIDPLGYSTVLRDQLARHGERPTR